MPTPIERLTLAETYMEEATQQVQDKLAIYCQRAIVAQLMDWKARYPRHEFSAWEGHGMLCFEVSPPIMGENDPTNLTLRRVGRLCAITQLAYEAQEFLDKWVGIECKITSSPLTSVIKI